MPRACDSKKSHFFPGSRGNSFTVDSTTIVVSVGSRMLAGLPMDLQSHIIKVCFIVNYICTTCQYHIASHDNRAVVRNNNLFAVNDQQAE